MRVLTLVPSQTGYSPGQRGSIELWEQVLRPEGIELDFVPFETEKLRSVLHSGANNVTKSVEMLKAFGSRVKLLSRVQDYDAVFVYREAALFGPAFLEKMIARKRPIIYQLDDPLFVPYKSPSNGYLSYLKFFGKIKEIIRISKVVIVNSSHIREYAENFNSNIWQIPSIVDTRRFKYEPQTDELSRVCVGWSGSPTTLKNIKMLEKPLQEISKENICDIHFIGGEDFGLRDVNYSAKKWSEETEVEDLRKMQIGLVPLPDNAWNRYKFIMKTAQYMALGIVPVGTPMASNPEVIRHGENGFLAGNDEEWTEYLMLLASDSELRMRLSENAAKDAESHYSLNANAAKVIEAFKFAADMN
ncbi:MAG TPA: glycosyltransferase family 4 protein [Pyrinomonadaceae bacterium]|nr:glycosyltransferase family 4 protein [Pyrinomonadaceae bacterium]